MSDMSEASWPCETAGATAEAARLVESAVPGGCLYVVAPSSVDTFETKQSNAYTCTRAVR